MSHPEAFEFLARMTAGLRPSSRATEADLRTVRSLLVASLRADVERRAEDDTERLLQTRLRPIDEETASELRAILDTEIPEVHEHRRAFRIRRRELPVAEAHFLGFPPT